MARLNTLEELHGELATLREEWPGLLTNPRLKFDAELEWVLQACGKNDYAAKTALGNPDSAKNALRNAASVGVTLDPARKLAYVLPRDGAMVYDISYMGMLDIAISSGAIQWGQAHLVYERDVFELHGYDAAPVHKRNPFAKPEERGDVIGVYVVVKTAGGDYLTNTMTVEDVNAIRARSPAFKQGKGPWKTDWPEMAKKTVVKNAYKYWPRSEALDRAVHFLNTEGGQGIELEGEELSHDAKKALRAEWARKVVAAATGEELRSILNEGREAFKEAQDLDGYNLLKASITQRLEQIKQPTTTAPAATQPAAKRQTAEPALDRVLRLLREAKTVADVEKVGPDIDNLPMDKQGPANDAYNARLDEIEGKK